MLCTARADFEFTVQPGLKPKSLLPVGFQDQPLFVALRVLSDLQQFGKVKGKKKSTSAQKRRVAAPHAHEREESVGANLEGNFFGFSWTP